MTPPPTLDELIRTVQTDTTGEDPLARLATAATTVASLEAVGDALLGHFVDQCRRAGLSWSEISGALGVTKQAAHKRFTGPAAPPALDRFTKRTRDVLEHAADAARGFGHNYIGTEHLLVAVLESREGLAALVLADMGVTQRDVVERVRARLPQSPAMPVAGAAGYTPRASQCLGRALFEALGLGHNYIGTEHLLLALLGDADSLATQVLTELGVEYAPARAAIVEKLSGYRA